MATLRKLELEEGKDSMIPKGYMSNFPNVKLFNHETGERRDIESVDEVEKGWQVLIYSIGASHNTSMIEEIIKRDDNTVTFRTQTSIYELTIPT